MTSRIFNGDGQPHDWELPPAPPWRQFNGGPVVDSSHEADRPHAIPMTSSALAPIGQKAARWNWSMSRSCCAGRC